MSRAGQCTLHRLRALNVDQVRRDGERVLFDPVPQLLAKCLIFASG